MGDAFENDYRWLALSWIRLAEILDEGASKPEGTTTDMANSLSVRGLFSRAQRVVN
jgi:hypothetical protein